MFWFAIIIGLLGLISFGLSYFIAKPLVKATSKETTDAANKRFDGQAYNDNVGFYRGTQIAGYVAGVLTGLFFLFSTMTTVSTGHVGVLSVFGKVHSEQISEGFHMINPLADVNELNIKIGEYTMSSVTDEGTVDGDDAVYCLSADGLTMPMDVTVMHRLIPDDAAWVYQNIGTDYVDKIIRPASRTAVRESISSFTAQEAYSTKRNDVPMSIEGIFHREVKRLLATYPNPREAFVTQILLRNIQLPPNLKAAIESKLAAEQEAEKMEFVLQKETQEAERKRIEATGIKDFQTIVSEGINANLLKWKGIEATEKLAGSANAKMVIIGGQDGLPIILNDK